MKKSVIAKRLLKLNPDAERLEIVKKIKGASAPFIFAPMADSGAQGRTGDAQAG